MQESDLAATFERQERIGYRSELITGEAEVAAHMKALLPDWRARGVTICLLLAQLRDAERRGRDLRE